MSESDLFSSEDEKSNITLNDDLFSSPDEKLNVLEADVKEECRKDDTSTITRNHGNWSLNIEKLATLDLFPAKLKGSLKKQPYIYFTVFEICSLYVYLAQAAKKIHLVGYLRRSADTDTYFLTEMYSNVDLSNDLVKIPLRFHENCLLPIFDEFKCVEVKGFLSNDAPQLNEYYFTVKHWTVISINNYEPYRKLLLEIRPSVPFVLKPVEDFS